MCRVAFFMQERIGNKKAYVNPCSALSEHLWRLKSRRGALTEEIAVRLPKVDRRSCREDAILILRHLRNRKACRISAQITEHQLAMRGRLHLRELTNICLSKLRRLEYEFDSFPRLRDGIAKWLQWLRIPLSIRERGEFERFLTDPSGRHHGYYGRDSGTNNCGADIARNAPLQPFPG